MKCVVTVLLEMVCERSVSGRWHRSAAYIGSRKFMGLQAYPLKNSVC
jgi:hypothetical protein